MFGATPASLTAARRTYSARAASPGLVTSDASFVVALGGFAFETKPFVGFHHSGCARVTLRVAVGEMAVCRAAWSREVK